MALCQVLQDAIASCPDRPTLVVVTHDQRSLDVFDTIYDMEAGVIRRASMQEV